MLKDHHMIHKNSACSLLVKTSMWSTFVKERKESINGRMTLSMCGYGCVYALIPIDEFVVV